MALYAAIIYGADLDYSTSEHGDVLAEYGAFGAAASAVITGGAALYPTSTATTVTVSEKGGDVVATDGPFAETKEVLTGFYLLECADLDEAISWAAQIPAAWDGKVEVRPVIPMGPPA